MERTTTTIETRKDAEQYVLDRICDDPTLNEYIERTLHELYPNSSSTGDFTNAIDADHEKYNEETESRFYALRNELVTTILGSVIGRLHTFE
jgi:hypothetical protein